jgi:N-acetylated-alpha-linked acidic dipeptidase
MADAQVLPLQFSGFASTMRDYVGELHTLLEDKRTRAAELTLLLDQNDFGLAADPTRVVASPEPQSPVPEVSLAPLDAVLTRLQTSAAAYDGAYTRLTSGPISLSSAQREKLNALLQSMEQRLTDARGLPGRDWFRHFIYAPGVLTGYGVKTLPGVREALEGDRWDEANRYAAITAQVLGAYCDGIDQATALLSGKR